MDLSGDVFTLGLGPGNLFRGGYGRGVLGHASIAGAPDTDAEGSLASFEQRSPIHARCPRRQIDLMIVPGAADAGAHVTRAAAFLAIRGSVGIGGEAAGVRRGGHCEW